MAEAPKRIWVRNDGGFETGIFRAVYANREGGPGFTEYVRADLYEEAMGMAKLAVEVLREKEGGEDG